MCLLKHTKFPQIKTYTCNTDFFKIIQLTLIQHGFELHGSIYTWSFKNKCTVIQRLIFQILLPQIQPTED